MMLYDIVGVVVMIFVVYLGVYYIAKNLTLKSSEPTRYRYVKVKDEAGNEYEIVKQVGEDE